MIESKERSRQNGELQDEQALRRKLPTQYWITLNDLLVPYGQNLCQPVSPFCSQCKLIEYCDQVGVTRSR